MQLQYKIWDTEKSFQPFSRNISKPKETKALNSSISLAQTPYPCSAYTMVSTDCSCRSEATPFWAYSFLLSTKCFIYPAIINFTGRIWLCFNFLMVKWWRTERQSCMKANCVPVFLAEFRHHNPRANPCRFPPALGNGEQKWCERDTRCLKHTVCLLYHLIMLFGPAMASCCYSQRSGSRAATHSQCHLKDFIIPGYKHKFIWNKWPRGERERRQIAGQHKEHCVDTQTCLGRAGGFQVSEQGQEWVGRGTYPMNIYPFAGSICVPVWGHSTAAQHMKAECKAFTGYSSPSEDRKTVLQKRLPYVVTGARARGQQHHARSAAVPYCPQRKRPQYLKSPDYLQNKRTLLHLPL